MNIKQNTSVFQNHPIKIFLILIFLFIFHNTNAQKNNRIDDSTFYYKNAIKGFVTILPLTGIYTSFSIGYERYISKHSALELGSFYLFNTDEMGLNYHTICIMPAYKYFTISKRKGLNNIWVSGYLSYLYETHTHPESEDNIRHSLYYYGIGGSIGKKIYLSKDKKLFLDIGFGGSYNIYDDKPIFSKNDWAKSFLPRPIIQIGGKF